MSITRVYLGNPAGPFGMQAIPAIFVGGSMSRAGAGMSATFGRGTISQTLVGGGTTTQRLAKLKTAYQLAWNIRGPVDVDLLMSFFDGGQGGGPYCLVDPSQSNYLPPNVARMGAVLGAFPEWAPTAGTLASSTSAGPTGLLTGVAAWSGASSGSSLYLGLNNVIDGTWLPPIVPGLSHRFDIYAKILSGSASLAATFLAGTAGAAGTSISSGSAVALTSSWVQFTSREASTTSWTSSEDYAGLKLVVSSASTPVILLAAASFVYDTATNASALPTWVSGIGVPRCVIPDTASSPVGITDTRKLRDFVMSLAEAA